MKFLVVDDVPEIVETASLCLELRYPGAIIMSAFTGKDCLELTQLECPDLVLLDTGLPDIDGFQLCREVRANYHVPVLMLSNYHRDLDVVRGLEAGADDYITKPFSHVELIARVQAILRRARSVGPTQAGGFRAGDLYMNFASREIRFQGEEIKLTPTEHRLLFHLVSNAGEVISYRELHTRVWGSNNTCKIQYLKIYVKHLRQKLEYSTTYPRLIHTIPRVGYKFAIPSQPIKSREKSMTGIQN